MADATLAIGADEPTGSTPFTTNATDPVGRLQPKPAYQEARP